MCFLTLPLYDTIRKCNETLCPRTKFLGTKFLGESFFYLGVLFGVGRWWQNKSLILSYRLKFWKLTFRGGHRFFYLEMFFIRERFFYLGVLFLLRIMHILKYCTYIQHQNTGVQVQRLEFQNNKWIVWIHIEVRSQVTAISIGYHAFFHTFFRFCETERLLCQKHSETHLYRFSWIWRWA